MNILKKDQREKGTEKHQGDPPPKKMSRRWHRKPRIKYKAM